MTARPLTIWAFFVIVLFSGLMNALQARANGELTRHIGNGVQAALISFATGLVILTLAVFVVPAFHSGIGRIRGAAGTSCSVQAGWSRG
jgi:transporter family-2 protein